MRHRPRHHPEQPEHGHHDAEQEPRGDPEEFHAIAPATAAAISAGMAFAIICAIAPSLPYQM